MDKTLIYDVGAHKGEDTEFYLKKGFRVVAIEAMPEFCESISKRFSEHVSSGALTVINVAVSNSPGNVKFYVDDRVSEWGTTNPEWSERNKSFGAGKGRTLTIPAAKLADILNEHGVPRYCKIDIEGNDLEALASLEGLRELPEFVSIESDKTSWKKLIEEFETFEKLGYRKYKILDQSLVSMQKCPAVPKEGKFVDWRFKTGSSGLFGDELPGTWFSALEAIEAYKNIFRGYAINGDLGLFGGGRKSMFNMVGRIQEKVFRLKGSKHYVNPATQFPPPGWYDTHAARE
ncbi:FkbM family methyltransferase [Bradyrhizobium uaiense]|nr:FkbM family methyltransferase [Bradyrhizobium uaiense]